VSASAPAAGGDLLDDQKRNLMPDLPVDQSAHLMCDLLLVPPVDLRDGHHAFQDAAVLGAVNARPSILRLRPRVPRGLRSLTAPARGAATGSCVMAGTMPRSTCHAGPIVDASTTWRDAEGPAPHIDSSFGLGLEPVVGQWIHANQHRDTS
jgi:hypothetical protein